MTDKLERILVIDDEGQRISTSCKLFGARARNIQVIYPEGEILEANERAKKRAKNYSESFDIPSLCIEAGKEEEIGRALAEECYRVILLDGKLGLNLEGESFDGKV